MIAVRFNQYVAVTANTLTGTDEIIKISAAPQGICGGRYISSLRLCVWSLHAETGFIYFKGLCPF
jgi:hypothetical protein